MSGFLKKGTGEVRGVQHELNRINLGKRKEISLKNFRVLNF